MHKEKVSINCEIFRKKEPLIKHITNRINKEEHILDKAKYAEELTKEVKELLDCSDYDGNKLNCKNCHAIANLRKKTANLIIKAKSLA